MDVPDEIMEMMDNPNSARVFALTMVRHLFETAQKKSRAGDPMGAFLLSVIAAKMMPLAKKMEAGPANEKMHAYADDVLALKEDGGPLDGALDEIAASIRAVANRLEEA